MAKGIALKERVTVPGQPGVQGVITARHEQAAAPVTFDVTWLAATGAVQVGRFGYDEIAAAQPIDVGFNFEADRAARKKAKRRK